MEHSITVECYAMLLNGVMLKGLNGYLKLVSDYRSLENSPLDIFVWNLFVVKYFHPLESPMYKNITFLFIVKNISFVQFLLCHTSDEKFLASYFPQTWYS